MLLIENQKLNKMDVDEEKYKTELELVVSKDVVDFVKPTKNVNCVNEEVIDDGKTTNKCDEEKTISTTPIKLQTNENTTKRIQTGVLLYGDCERSSAVKSSLSSLEKLHIFNFHPRKKSNPLILSASEKPKFVKSASIARLFGNSYSTKRTEPSQPTPIKTTNNERFHKSVQLENGGDELQIRDFNEPHDMDLSAKAMRTLTKGLGRLLRRRTSSLDISEPDPEFKVAYLGNVLTGWAKGEGCVEKPLATLWRNYTQNSKPDVIMKIRVCSSGLKATTKQHGLTEYWSHRITHCSSPKNYPRVFCWVYRHEGRKLKHEMRCHAVLCSKETIAKDVGKKLQDNIARALREFKRDKISRQNARLSLVNSVYDNPSMPRRKILLSVGGNNYRPPLERSKSAPKLMAIEEMVGEEDDEEEEDEDDGVLGEKLIQDKLYLSTTLGRRRRSREHLRNERKSIIKCETPKLGHADPIYKSFTEDESEKLNVNSVIETDELNSVNSIDVINKEYITESEEDFSNLLLNSNYNLNDEPLESEIMSYFDMKLRPTTASLVDLNKTLTDKTLTEVIRNTQSLDDLDNYSDNEPETSKDVFFNQSDILEILRNKSLQGSQQQTLQNSGDNNNHYRNLTPEAASDCDSPTQSNDLAYIKINTSIRRSNLVTENDKFLHNKKSEKYFNLMLNQNKLITSSSDDDCAVTPRLLNSVTIQNHNNNNNNNMMMMLQLDSDEGSISSGCETLSNVTTNADEQQTIKLQLDDDNNNDVMLEPIGEKTNIEFRRSLTYPNDTKRSYQFNSHLNVHNNDSDSELSDESGYVEYQENNKFKVERVIM